MGIIRMNKKGFRLIGALLLTAILFTFVHFSTSSVSADSLSNDEEGFLTEELLQQLKDEGVVGQEVQLEDLQVQTGDGEPVEEIESTDNLSEYNLDTDKDGNIISKRNAFSTYASYYFYPGSAVYARPGDILITNSTSSNGLFGHAGIVSSSGIHYASIRNSKSHPELNSLKSWFEDYPNTKVIRVNNTTLANKAGTWATNYVYNNLKATYSITLAINSIDPTYCSKIVWQAYAKTGDAVGTASWTIKAPYGFLKKGSYHSVTPKVVYTKGSNFGSGDF